jgi:hypothetical protein
MESTLAAASVPQTKQGRHLNLRAHWLRDVQTLSDLVLAHLKGALNDPTRAWLHCILWLRYTHATHLGAVTPLGYARPLSCSQLHVDVITISALSGSAVTIPPPAPQAL